MPQFAIEIIEAAYERQNGSYGLCGKQLVGENYKYGDMGIWHAHHINRNNTDLRLSNYVCLCINKPENCHLKAHYGDFAGDYVYSKSDFPYFN